MTHKHEITEEMRKYIQDCLDCHSTCTETVSHCLQMGGKHAEAAFIRLLLDCAQICQTSVDFMLRTSHFQSEVCGTCSEICKHCVEECIRIGGADATIKECADACRRCAVSCEKMSGLLVA